MADHVILIHGLWMRGFSLLALRRRLQQAGYGVSLFDYASVFRGPEASITRLLRRSAMRRGDATLHLVGHSLGGLIALQALQREPELTHGRVVCLGSPLRGSSVARGLASLPGGGFLIGGNLEILRNGLDHWSGTQAVGSIAGSRPAGLGVATGALIAPHDGTVSVAETQLPGLADHCVVLASHTGLPFSAEAAEQTIAFLGNGRFARTA